jgi:uncharacterized protein (DUF2126 family)
MKEEMKLYRNAFEQIPKDKEVPFWMDRIFRNLLTDITGNTQN